MRIWLDDIRDPPDETWSIARSFSDVQHLFLLCAIFGEAPEVMSFDHDLGEEKDGYDVIKWIVERHPNFYPEVVLVHSANGPGAENIEKYDQWFRRVRSDGDPQHPQGSAQ